MRKVTVLVVGVLVAAGILFLRCSDDCPVGSERCPCTGGGICDPGLECRSGLCVAAAADADAGWDIPVDVGADAEADSPVEAETAPDVGADADADAAEDDAVTLREGNMCLSAGGGPGFCGTDCSHGEPCPAVASCQDIGDGSGGIVGRQCVPDYIGSGDTCRGEDWNFPSAFCVSCETNDDCIATGDVGFCARTPCADHAACPGGERCVLVHDLCYGPVCGAMDDACAALEASRWCSACDAMDASPIANVFCGAGM